MAQFKLQDDPKVCGVLFFFFFVDARMFVCIVERGWCIDGLMVPG